MLVSALHCAHQEHTQRVSHAMLQFDPLPFLTGQCIALKSFCYKRTIYLLGKVTSTATEGGDTKGTASLAGMGLSDAPLTLHTSKKQEASTGHRTASQPPAAHLIAQVQLLRSPRVGGSLPVPGQDGTVAHKRHQPKPRQKCPQCLGVLTARHVALHCCSVLGCIVQAALHIPGR